MKKTILFTLFWVFMTGKTYSADLIGVASPAYCSDIQGNTEINIIAPTYTQVKVYCWKNGNGLGTNTLVGTVTLDNQGNGSIVFPADSYPHGPVTLRISGTNSVFYSDNCYLQLYNKGGVSWKEGLPATPAAAEGMNLVFTDDFDGALSIGNNQALHTYYDHKPPYGSEDFSSIPFTNYNNTVKNPFSQVDSYLRIRADANKNSTGLISSLFSNNKGVKVQMPCYFECRLIGPNVKGSWPAFWLLSVKDNITDRNEICDELDIIEAYGGEGDGTPNAKQLYRVTPHAWGQTGRPQQICDDFYQTKGVIDVYKLYKNEIPATWYESLHTYGCKITETETIYYYDNVEVGRHETLPVSKTKPLYFMINLATGGGWPVDLSRYGGVMDMYVDYVRVYSGAPTQLSNLPAIHVTTENNEPVLDKENYVQGNVIVKSSEPAEELSMVAGIRLRGNASFRMDKKSFRIKLDKKTNLLNLPAKAKSWVLLANHADKTLIRNAVAFKIGNMLGFDFNPSVRFVDLVLNGSYLGNYLLTDQIEVNENRVNIDEQEATDIIEPNITGGYLLEQAGDPTDEPVWFLSGKEMKLVIKSPDSDVITDAQIQYIKNYISDFENRLFSDGFKDLIDGYRAKVDTTSLINWYIACELTGNSDAFWSIYLYKKRSDDKLYFGPLWDFDIAFNNDNRLGDATRKLMRKDAWDPKAWIQQMWLDDWFRNAVKRRWQQLVVDGNLLQELTSYINETSRLINQSQQLNFTKWNILNKQIYLETFLFGTYQEGVDYLKSYLTNRIDFLTENFLLPSGILQSGLSTPKVEIYPNPASDQVQVSVTMNEPQEVTVAITDLRGIQKYQTSKSYVSGRSVFPISLTGFNPGIYLVYIQGGKDEKTIRKLIVIH
ncbi:MAG: CotH kinase family protein [Dysgonamonadaceae bacterium]|jgi:beta-glucanase (GH16 family)|nr:CotH kinase family protein [Dysgonamonadaceae bacterium]